MRIELLALSLLSKKKTFRVVRAAAGAVGSFTVVSRDTLNHVAANYTGTVYFSSSDAQAGLPVSYTFTAADAGVHVFSATLKTAGTQTLYAGDYAIGISGSQGGIGVTAAAPSTLTVTGPATTVAGVAQSVSTPAARRRSASWTRRTPCSAARRPLPPAPPRAVAAALSRPRRPLPPRLQRRHSPRRRLQPRARLLLPRVAVARRQEGPVTDRLRGVDKQRK